MNTTSDNLLIEETFDTNSNPCILKLSDSFLSIARINNGDVSSESIATQSIPLDSIIALHHRDDVKRGTKDKLMLIEFHILSTTTTSVEYIVLPFTFQCRCGSALNAITKWRLAFHPPMKPCCRFNKKFLIVINPRGGNGTAVKQFDSVIKPLLTVAGVPYEVIVTKYSCHAINIARDMCADDWHGVVLLSGDGLIHQFVNGLANRPDWKRAMEVPLALLPCGTSNALTASVLRHSRLWPTKTPLLAATLLLIKHRQVSTSLDIAYIETRHSHLYSAVVTLWGFSANITNDAENYRWLGVSRYLIVALKTLATLKTYAACIAYLPYENKSEATGTERIVSDSGRSVCYLPLIDQELPSYWKKSDANYIGALVCTSSNLSTTLCLLPDASLDDGALYLILLRAGATAREVGSLFHQVETNPTFRIQSAWFVEVHKIVAFRITPPDNDRGGLNVDGERLDDGPIQGEVIPGLARVVTKDSLKRNINCV